MVDIKEKFSRHTYSYWTLRKAVGWIGLLLPFVLMLGGLIIFHGKLIEGSISYYYHTGMGDVFVGALCAVALFLFFYSGFDKWDDWAGNLAGLFAIGVAWFPTTKSGPEDWVGIIHLTCAVLFFLILASFSFFLFTKTAKDKGPTKQKKKRNVIYRICGLVMVASLIAIVIFMAIRDDNSKFPFVFLGETIALVAFGISWLTKGEAIYPDKK
ncbi:MAG: hypothetical protein AMS23_06475 [Bacteroides sp. SM1_62]|nr:MAG: hypothetical protein AMS26_07805 [Bacteroides sp. SM23_62]KPL23555.1 MAG: hypothetical protein AMS23_06475 [Bacteroides sp. SM1_62]